MKGKGLAKILAESSCKDLDVNYLSTNIIAS
jgi:hypothetical protein